MVRRGRARRIYIHSERRQSVLADSKAPWVARSVPGSEMVLQSETVKPDCWFQGPCKIPSPSSGSGKSKRACANYAQVKRGPNRTQVLPELEAFDPSV